MSFKDIQTLLYPYFALLLITTCQFCLTAVHCKTFTCKLTVKYWQQGFQLCTVILHFQYRNLNYNFSVN